MRMKTTHQLGLSSMRIVDSNTLLLCGRDGKVSLCSISGGCGGAGGGGGASFKQKQIFHHHHGGVIAALLLKDGRGFCAVDAGGTFSILEIQSEEEEQRESLVRSRGELASETAIVRRLMDLNGDLEMMRDPKLAKDYFKEEELTSWSEKLEASDHLRKRKAYEGEIYAIESSLETIRKQVEELLIINEELPEGERLDGAEFELNAEERQRRMAEAQEEEAELRLEMRARQAAMVRAGGAIRKEVWDDLEFPGRAIVGLGSKELVVRNYPMLAVEEDEKERLALAQAERKTALDFRKLTTEMQRDGAALQQELSTLVPRHHGRGGESARASASSSARHQPTSSSPRDASPSSRSGGKARESAAAEGASLVRFMGSHSHKFVGVDSAQQLKQLEVTTKIQILQQMAHLKVLYRTYFFRNKSKTYLYFNKLFFRILSES